MTATTEASGGATCGLCGCAITTSGRPDLYVHANTLRVRAVTANGKRVGLPIAGETDEKRAARLLAEIAATRWLVVCESGTCEPKEGDVGYWHRGRPAWDLRNEGGWLADRLEQAKAIAS